MSNGALQVQITRMVSDGLVGSVEMASIPDVWISFIEFRERDNGVTVAQELMQIVCAAIHSEMEAGE